MTEHLQQWIITVLLGLIQGLTEWLPISSTGHLKLFEILLGFEGSLGLTSFDLFLHVGTLIVIMGFFRKQIGKILSAFVHLEFSTEQGRMVPLTIVGVLPTFLIGAVVNELVGDTFRSIFLVGGFFLLCGVVLYSSKFGKEKIENITYFTAVLVGIAQGVAVLPGISRSGVTIAVALLLGVKREKAFKFSFILSIPAILGALCYTVYTEFGELTSAGVGWGGIFVGTIVAMFVGYFALKLLWKTVVKRNFYLFSIYCWSLGALLVLLGLFQPFRLAG